METGEGEWGTTVSHRPSCLGMGLLYLPLPPAEQSEIVPLRSFRSTAHTMGGLPGMPREVCWDRATSPQRVGKAHGWCPTSDPFCQLPEPKHGMHTSLAGKQHIPRAPPPPSPGFIQPFWLVFASYLPNSKLLALPPQPWPFGRGVSIQSYCHLALALPLWALMGLHNGMAPFLHCCNLSCALASAPPTPDIHSRGSWPLPWASQAGQPRGRS